MKHLVITIGCEYGAKGNAIGKKIAQDLGIKFYDRDLVDEIIKEVGIPTDIMDRVEEGGTIAGKGAQGDVRGSFSKYADLTDRAIHVQKQIIRKLAQKEACVIIGRSADYILKDTEGIQLVRAFIMHLMMFAFITLWKAIIFRKRMQSFCWMRRINVIIRDIWH